ncbi:hypothetical protein CVT26_015757 [Gymnopilus dilepis]|uniref:Cytochrome P450 n=1 Tax=Gymnopilus dilepis TaxID=231916 RepID=A0A409VFN5_9AGAR|nr:hypothetical protein CVT26_015757 [Gymnopilus dilepis]
MGYSDPTYGSYWLSATAVLVFSSWILKSYWDARKLPPGPRGLPILGNMFQVPAQMPWFKFTEWSQQYGPVFSFNVAGQVYIVLNTFKAAADLLEAAERRSNIYSDRPRMIVANEILGGGLALPFARYDNRFRKMRRAAHEGLSARAVQKYEHVEAREAAATVVQILEAPERWYDHIKRTSASTILAVLYGWPSVKTEDENLIHRIASVVIRMVKSVVPGTYLVNVFPFLNHLPRWMASWKRDGLEWHRRDTEMFMKFNKEVQEKTYPETSASCFVSDLLENTDANELSEEEAAWLPGTMLSAAAESTSATLNSFILAMVLYPTALRKAQAELDAVVGRERAPTFSDQKNLPYIDALIKEILRWRPPGPMGWYLDCPTLSFVDESFRPIHLALPRSVMEDDWYDGFYIPKGATIFPNIWAMHRDPPIFSDPEDFMPERFFGEIPEDTHSTGHTSFGFGRRCVSMFILQSKDPNELSPASYATSSRICVGISLANQMLFINVAVMLWALNIKKATDSEGNFIVPSPADFVDTGIVVFVFPLTSKVCSLIRLCLESSPAPFKCKFSPRFPNALSILQRDLEET